MQRSLFIALFLPIYFASGFASEKPELIWAFATSSTTMQPSGLNIVDENHNLFKLFKKELHQYDHKVLKGTLPRIEKELKNQKNVCYPGSTEFTRRKKFTYLTPMYVQPSPQLVVTEVLGQRLLNENQNGLTLKNIMEDKKLRGSLAEGRSYGETIDHILNSKQGNIKRRVYNTFIQTVVDQIKIGRVDYTIEYAFVVQALQNQSNENKIRLMTIPLKDVGPYVTQYTACSKTPEGLNIIEKLDEVIRKNINKPEYWAGVLESVPRAEKKEFQKKIDFFIKDRQKGPYIIL